MPRKHGGKRKVRVDFRQNRSGRRRENDWTGQYQRSADEVTDTELTESVRPKGELSRKRTVIFGESDVPSRDEAEWESGVVTRVHGLICYVDDARGHEWECTVRRVIRTLLMRHRTPVVVGDRVAFTAASDPNEPKRIGVIERVADRATVLSRRVLTGHDQKRIRSVGSQKPQRIGREHTIAANVDTLVVVASVAQPRLKPHLIDRYLVAAHKGKLRPVICFNKCDLDEDVLDVDTELSARSVAQTPESSESADDTQDSTFSLQDLIDEYRALGYTCLRTSATTGAGLAELRGELRERVTVLSGQSGVGKSSLINAVQPGMNLTVGDVSDENEKGRHTTSHAQLIRLDFGGYVVDTPGVRGFDLWAVEAGELEAHFVEFIPYIQKCRFRDCTHRFEDGCAIIAAVQAGEIGPRRHDSYLKLFDEV